MLMKNTSKNIITIPANLTEGWRGPSDVTFQVPPGGIVEIVDSYACRGRYLHTPGSAAMVRESIASQVSGGALAPHGAAAIETFKLFADELPAVIAERARHRSGEMGVAASVDTQAEKAKREAMEIGFALMAARGRLRNESMPVPTPRVFTDEDLGPDV